MQRKVDDCRDKLISNTGDNKINLYVVSIYADCFNSPFWREIKGVYRTCSNTKDNLNDYSTI